MFETQFDTYPKEPGCYLMRDKAGKVFYVGKAINLRNRIRSYFSGQDTRKFVFFLERILHKIDIIVVSSDREAILLEKTLIEKYKPKYNILLKDGKNFISLRLSKPNLKGPLHEQFPKLEITRRPKLDKARYFGPYPSASKLRSMLQQIDKYFKLRTCSDRMIDHRTRPCVQYEIGRCCAPCVFHDVDYQHELENVELFLKGQTREIEKRLEQSMLRAAQAENFERAAQIRDQISSIQDSVQKQSTHRLGQKNNEDIFGFARQEGFLEIVRVPVRAGRVLEPEHYGFENQEFPTEDLLSSFLNQFYEVVSAEEKPDLVILPPLKKGGWGGFQDIQTRTPQRGKLLDLVHMATKNAQHALQERMKNLASHQDALKALQACVGLTKLPKIIECFDISLFQGTDSVGSQVCFIDGVPDRSRYRKYNIKTVQGTDDYASLHEVLTRRLKKGDFPDLLLVDGGKGQLGVAMAALKDLGLKLPVAGIAKDPERLFLPNVKNPIILKEHTKERYLLERIRDEAHRFAITGHRAKRSKRILGPPFYKSKKLS